MNYLKAAIEKVPDVLPFLTGRAWWLGLEVEEAKTYNYYLRVLKKDINRLYGGEINTNLFVDNLAGYVERQMRRAWNEGMRLNGLDPKDMTAEWEAIYQELVVSEYEYIERLAGEIVQAKLDGKPVDQFISRVELWANRYTDVVNRSLAATKPDQLLRWEYGATEEHCTDCAARAGTAKTGKEWEADILPQSHDLECGGWRCDCRLVSGITGMLFALEEQRIEMLFAPAERNQ